MCPYPSVHKSIAKIFNFSSFYFNVLIRLPGLFKTKSLAFVSAYLVIFIPVVYHQMFVFLGLVEGHLSIFCKFQANSESPWKSPFSYNVSICLQFSWSPTLLEGTSESNWDTCKELLILYVSLQPNLNPTVYNHFQFLTFIFFLIPYFHFDFFHFHFRFCWRFIWYIIGGPF